MRESLSVNGQGFRRQAQDEIVRAKTGTHQAELLSGESPDKIPIDGTAQEALGDDQTKSRSRHFIGTACAVM